MGTIPSTPAFGSSVATSTNMNLLRAVDAFQGAPPQCFCYQSAVTTIATSAGLTAGTALAFAAEVFDVPNNYDGGGDAGHHDNATNNTRLYVRTTGKYRIEGKVQWANNSTGDRVAALRLNAGGSYSGGTLLDQDTRRALNNGSCSCKAETVYPLNAGDYVEVFGSQNSGGNLDTVSGLGNSYLRATLVSA